MTCTWTVEERVAEAIARARGCNPFLGLPAGIMVEARAAVKAFRLWQTENEAVTNA